MRELFEVVEEEIPNLVGWNPTEEQELFKMTEDSIVAPISELLTPGKQYEFLDKFILSKKQAYRNRKGLMPIMHKFLNYYTAYFDTNHSLISAYATIKVKIDYDQNESYSIDDLKRDIKDYILTGSTMVRMDRLNELNYALNLKFNTKKEVLAYTDVHGKIMYKISGLMKMIIPIICHYAYKKTWITSMDDFIMDMYSIIFDQFNIDIISKFDETILAQVNKSQAVHPGIWNMQGIRGVDDIIQSTANVNHLIRNVMPKYEYDGNIISLNQETTRNQIDFTVVKNEYEFEFHPQTLTVGSGDENEEDKFEDQFAKQDQAMLIHNLYNYEWTMNRLEESVGYIDPNEVQFYVDELSNENDEFIWNEFQRELVFLYFYKQFGDYYGIIGNRDDYVKLMIIMRRQLLNVDKLKILPYILTGKFTRQFNKTSLKKSDKIKVEDSNWYYLLQEKYQNDPKNMKRIDSIIATIMNLRVTFIDYYNPEIHGQKISIKSKYVLEELLQFIVKIQ